MQSDAKSNASGTANLKIDNTPKPVSGQVTPRTSGAAKKEQLEEELQRSGILDKGMMRRSGQCLAGDGEAHDTAETKKQFANAIALNQKA